MSEADEGAKARAPGTVEELHRADFAHLELGHWPAVASSADQHLLAAARGGSLPYDVLDSHAFERLCFHLLLAKSGGPARFWGRRGQAQQGIDLILSNGVASTVYQCKHAATFNAADLSHAAHKFRDTWLKQAGLGKPDKFVLCTSAKVTDTTAWEVNKRELADEIGVAIDEWHRDTLDVWLRHQPGIVAELFGDRVAEAFCGRAQAGNAGIFRPMLRGQEHRIDRYLDLLAARRLVRFEQDRQTFARCLGEHQTVLLGGQAGAGKTMSALDLAAGFEGGSWRVFYLRANASDDLDRLVSAMLAYAFRPTIFVVDDCQLAFDAIERLNYRVSGANHGLKLVLTARTPPAASDAIEPNGTSFIEALREQGQVMDLVVDDTRFSAVVTARAPGWAGKRLAKLMAWSGRDLTILDLLLDAVGPVDVDDVRNLNDLLPTICTHLFGAKAVSAPHLKRLAAVAQFEVPVPAFLFPDPLESGRNATAITRLVLASGQPRSLAFHHASTAELLFQVLAWAHGQQDPVAACADDCAEVLLLAAQQLGRPAALESLLLPMLRSPLSLSDADEIKRRLFANSKVLALLSDSAPSPGAKYVNVLSWAAAYCRNTDMAPRYAALLASAIEADLRSPGFSNGIELLGESLRSLRLTDALASHSLEQRLGGTALAGWIGARGTLMDLLRVLEGSSSAFAAELLQVLQPAQMDSLAQRMLDNQVSIGTLNLALRELAKRPLPDDPGRTQLQLFEQLMSGAVMARLIVARGTLDNLLKILQYSSDAFAFELLQAFQPAQMASLVQRMLDKKASIGTLNLALRELGTRPLPDDPGRTQLHLFEQQMGGAAMARLIGARGTLIDLLRVLANSSDAFAAELLRSFQPAQMASLMQRTLDNEAAIGTLHLALRELGTRPLPADPGRTQLHLFEQQLGGAVMARLIGERGTLVNLLKILAQCSDAFAAELLRSFQPAQMDSLVQRMLDKQASIGTLSLALLELATRPLPEGSGRTQLKLFEERWGAKGFWTLIAGQGNLHHLARIVAALSPEFRLTAFSPPFNPDQSGWEALALKGSLYSLGRFAADGLPLLPGAVSLQFERVAASIAFELTANSTWGEVAAAINQVERLPATDPVRVHVTTAARQRWQSVDLDAIEGLDYVDATDALSVLWRERSDLQPELGARLWRILPNEAAWPTTYKLLLQSRHPLAMARSKHVSDTDAQRLLRAFAPLSPAASLDPKSARYHALFLWSLYALWFDRGQRWAPGFAALQAPETWQRFVAVVKQRLAWRRNVERLETLMLAGALVYLVPGLRRQLDSLVRGQIKGAVYLMKQIDSDMTFLPAVLMCHGLALHLPKLAVFSPKRIESLLSKAADYPEQGAALLQLCGTLRSTT